MPRAKRHCPGDDGQCRNVINSSRRYCPDHQPTAWQGKRTTSSSITNTAAWKKLRRKILERDRHQCQIRGPYCTGHATQVDHIINTASGGAPLDEGNAQSVCPQCNARKASQEAAAARAAKPRRTNRRTPEPHPGLRW